MQKFLRRKINFFTKIISDMLSFQKKNAGQRATTSFQPAIFARAGRARDTYTMNLKIHFKVMVWITVISTVNMEDF